jgi:hypothetical protein
MSSFLLFSLIPVSSHQRSITSDECLHGPVNFFNHEFLCVSELKQTVLNAELFIILELGLLKILGDACVETSE